MTDRDHHDPSHRVPVEPEPAGVSVPSTRPDAGLTQWFVETDVFASGEPTTDRAYADYLEHCAGSPLPRRRFVHDLRLLGVWEAVADQTSLLVRG